MLYNRRLLLRCSDITRMITLRSVSFAILPAGLNPVSQRSANILGRKVYMQQDDVGAMGTGQR